MQNYIKFSLTLFPPPGSSHILGQGIVGKSSRKMVRSLSSQIKAILQPENSKLRLSRFFISSPFLYIWISYLGYESAC